MVNLREQSELEGMLRMCIMDLGDSWNDHLPLVELVIITATIVALKWHHMKLSMEENVDPPYFGMRLERERVDWT